MKNLKHIVIFLLIVLAATWAKGAEKITGAFGFKFGEVLDESALVDIYTDDDDDVVGVVIPKVKDPIFSQFYVMVTAKSRQIRNIRGAAYFQTRDEAMKQMKALQRELEKKHGPKSDEKVEADQTQPIYTGQEFVTMEVTSLRKQPALVIQYSSPALDRLSKLEEEKLPFFKIDGAFGLKFGDTLDAATIIRKESRDGEDMYLVRPAESNGLFQTYEVSLTPENRMIRQIRATGTVDSEEEADLLAEALTKYAAKKYGPERERKNDKDSYGIVKPEGFILVHAGAAAGGKGSLRMVYQSAILSEPVKKEVPPVANGKIEGAFGFTLGEVFDPAQAVEVKKLNTGEPIYKVTPKNPNASFNAYFLSITPKTKRIYQIWAQSDYESDADGLAQQEALVKVLESKYEVKRSMFDSEEARILMQQTRSIIIKAARYPSGAGKLDLKYVDSKIENEGKKEAAEVDPKNVDSKGL